MSVLDQWPRCLDTQPLDRFGRRHADGGRKHTAELTYAHVRHVCQTLNGQVIAQVIARIAQHRADAIRARVQIQQ
ncbi:hypothetical protein D9M73_239950 [compost metagenome]